MPRAEAYLARQLVTPEGAALQIRLGDAGARAGAFMIDLLIMAVTVIVAGALIIWAAVSNLIKPVGLGGSAGLQLFMIGWLVFFFLLRNGYFILWEAGGRSATPGKRLCALRVVSADGTALTLDQVIARNLMREIEIFLPLTMLMGGTGGGGIGSAATVLGLGWALTFTLFPLFNRDRLRVGDLLAGTRVIVVPRAVLLDDLAEQLPATALNFRFTTAQLDAYGIAELQKLEDVLRADNAEAWWVVARAIVDRIGWAEPLHDARPFLLAYYEALRAHLERGVLLGRRREDKFMR